jgi:hypothetical protein
MSAAILVLVRSPEEVELARALVGSLPELPFSLLFGSEDLRQRFGPLQHPSSVDLGRFFVEPQRLRLSLCFSGARELGPSSNLLWLSFLNEIGVPTVEIQRDPLQDTAQAARESTARHYLAWGGTDGIGDLKGAAGAPRAAFARDDVVIVSSRLDGDEYREEERFRFVFALLRLAREHPDHTFLWRPGPGELNSTEAATFWSLLEKLAPKNLFVEEHESLAQLLARSRCMIGMLSSAWLDAAAAHKPGLAFVRPGQELGPFALETFSSHAALEQAWTALEREPQRFQVRCALPRFAPEAVAQRLEALALPRERGGAVDTLPIALRYLAYYQEGRGRAEQGKLSASLTGLEKRVGELGEKLHDPLRKVVERVDALQRLSVTHQALRLFGTVRKRALKR